MNKRLKKIPAEKLPEGDADNVSTRNSKKTAELTLVVLLWTLHQLYYKVKTMKILSIWQEIIQKKTQTKHQNYQEDWNTVLHFLPLAVNLTLSAHYALRYELLVVGRQHD